MKKESKNFIEKVIKEFKKYYIDVGYEITTNKYDTHSFNLEIYYYENEYDYKNKKYQDYVDICFSNNIPQKFEFGEYTTVSNNSAWLMLFNEFCKNKEGE